MVGCGNGRLAIGENRYHTLSLLSNPGNPCLSHNSIKLLTGFNGNSHFIIMHFTVRAWQHNVAQKREKERVKSVIKSPTDVLNTLVAETVAH